MTFSLRSIFPAALAVCAGGCGVLSDVPSSATEAHPPATVASPSLQTPNGCPQGVNECGSLLRPRSASNARPARGAVLASGPQGGQSSQQLVVPSPSTAPVTPATGKTDSTIPKPPILLEPPSSPPGATGGEVVPPVAPANPLRGKPEQGPAAGQQTVTPPPPLNPTATPPSTDTKPSGRMAPAETEPGADAALIPVPPPVPAVVPPPVPSPAGKPVAAEKPFVWKPDPVVAGQQALGVEAIRCHEPNEALVLVESGIVSAVDETGVATVTLKARFSAWFDRRQKGIDARERWCIPRRRVCWGKAEFADWNGTDKQDGSRGFSPGLVTLDGNDAMPGLVEAAARGACHLAP